MSIKRISLILLFLVPLLAHSQAPELSADSPISFSQDTGMLVAVGNAVYVDENTTVEADEIRYNREEERIEASGNVRVTRKGLRLLAEYLTYNAKDKSFSAKNFRAGYPPVFIDGESFSGNLEDVNFNNINLYFREPVSSSPKLFLREGRWVADEFIKGRGLQLKAFGDLGIPLPGMTYSFGQAAVDVDAAVGFKGNLGVFAQTNFLYPFTDKLAAGVNLDLYSKRGLLIGPALRWSSNEDRTRGHLNTGWIHDQSTTERGVDVLGDEIEQDRGFVDFGYSLRNEGSLQFNTRGTYLTDSETLRDFREDLYFHSFHPDNFVDFTWQESDFLLNVFSRFQLNEFYGMVERLPEIRGEWLPHEILDTGVYIQASAAATRYRHQFIRPTPDSVEFPSNPLGLPAAPLFPGLLPAEMYDSTFYNRLDGALTLTKPFHSRSGLDLVLRAGGRWSNYNREADRGVASASDERLVGELGADLTHTLARTYYPDLASWGIERLRHQVRALAQYRWHPGADEAAAIAPPFDIFHYRPSPPVLDLADLDHLDGMAEWSVARIGWENQILVAGEDEAFREFLTLNFYQDIQFSDDDADRWDALYAGMEFSPLPWFHLNWSQKFRPEDGETEATYIRTSISSSDLWNIGAQAEYLQGAIHQYIFNAEYRLSENFGLLGNWHYDARLSTWTYQRYGIVHRFGNVWQMDLYLTLNERNGRQDNFGVGLRLRWLNF